MNEKKYGVHQVYHGIRERLVNYIKSDYLANSETLLLYADDFLGEGCPDDINIAREPYIETAASYKKAEGGLQGVTIDDKIKKILLDLAEKDIGIYKTPFTHQVTALEEALKGKNLFISTGTGSGKTECFLWPIIARSLEEALYRPEDFQKEAVRTLIIYPMNALVSDQLARFRKSMGSDAFIDLFTEELGLERIPHFGMYTGRTPYSGKAEDPWNKKRNEELAKTYRKQYLVNENASEEEQQEQRRRIEGYQQIYKYPARYGKEEGIKCFIENLEANKHEPGALDAEYLTRFEMQCHTPDILVTNYSMLEYMLMRKRESKIWGDTRQWLSQSEENKLLIVLDEAHMYRGSSGGEIALLIDRLLSRVGAPLEKVQFILTTASMPSGNDEAIASFYKGLTGKDYKNCITLFGEKEPFSKQINIKTDAKALASIGTSQVDGDEIGDRIRRFAKTIFGIDLPQDQADEALQEWLYDHLPEYEAYVELYRLCREGAKSYSELKTKIFGGVEEAQEALDALLVIASLAKKGGNILFPVRLHMFMRGLQGLYACSNPHCSSPHKHYSEAERLPIGRISSHPSSRCECGGKMYELVNHVKCGALYFRVFAQFMKGENYCYVFPREGMHDRSHQLEEMHLYICPENYRRKEIDQIGFLDPITGRLYYEGYVDSDEACLKVLYSKQDEKSGKYIFKSCPKCEKPMSLRKPTDFATKGNIPFYNLTKAQFELQPAKSTTLRNQGKKVL